MTKPKVSLDENLNKLLQGLAEAQCRAIDDKETSGREGAIWALVEIAKFLQRLSADANDPQTAGTVMSYSSIFWTLGGGLIQLKDGIVAPILKAGEKSNRSPTPKYILIRRAQAAAAVEILVACGCTVEAAAKEVASYIAGREELDGIKREQWKAVQRWRTDIKPREGAARPTAEDVRSDPRAAFEEFVFDENIRNYHVLLTTNNTTPEMRKGFAFVVLDQERLSRFQKGPS